MVEQAAQDYSKLLQGINLDKEINPICMSMEDMLTRLDELESMLVNVQVKNNAIMNQHTSGILAFTPHFNILKERIDKLEQFVDVVNTNVDEVEKSLDIAEAELNVTDYSLNGLIFKPLLAKVKSVSNSSATTSPVEEPITASNLIDGNFQAISIFKTSDYFNKDVTAEEVNNQEKKLIK